MYNVAMMLQHGTGTGESSQDAAKWFKKAAEAGMPPAQYSLSLCYRKGYGVPKSDEWADVWFKRAADQVKRLQIR